MISDQGLSGFINRRVFDFPSMPSEGIGLIKMRRFAFTECVDDGRTMENAVKAFPKKGK